jgi:hypothetical protein
MTAYTFLLPHLRCRKADVDLIRRTSLNDEVCGNEVKGTAEFERWFEIIVDPALKIYCRAT